MKDEGGIDEEDGRQIASGDFCYKLIADRC